MGRIVGMLVVGVTVVGVLLALSLPRTPRTAKAAGFRLRGDDVRFVFRPRGWRHTTLLAGGDTVPLRELRVRRVALARPGAGGTLRLDALERDEGTWEFRARDAAPAPGESLYFGFVVNDRFWAEPPAGVPNRAPFPGSPSRHGLVVTRPAPE